ncbi:2Fe-2S ferredoxin-type domain-containing protein [Plasmodiophora brassicae]
MHVFARRLLRRPLAARWMSEGGAGKQTISAIWVEPSGQETPTRLEVGENLLNAAHANDIDLEGACECSLACSTCHVVLEPKVYEALPEPSDEENDMLDMAYGLTETSRLGCQVIVRPDMDGMRIKLPAATRNFAVDGFVPKPHH